MNWSLLVEILYYVILIAVVLRVIYDTENSSKTLGYLLLITFLPVVGMVFYFLVGMNYRKRKIYAKKMKADKKFAEALRKKHFEDAENLKEDTEDSVEGGDKLAKLLFNSNRSPLTTDNEVEVLINGENKFPVVLEILESAKEYIHLEYYIYADDETGKKIEEVLIRKAKEGVKVRMIYDDLGSRGIRRGMAKRLKKAGVEIYPFYEINFLLFANRVNYRNHRKIIIADGQQAFVGGINVSNDYVNSEKEANQKDKLFWRDTHLQLRGTAVWYLQYLFLLDWNYCAEQDLKPDKKFFPDIDTSDLKDPKIVQIASGGPDSDTPAIQHSMMQAINLAQKEVLITTPYFIPGDSLMDTIEICVRSGITVKMLLPGKSDSKIVKAASCSYYDRLLTAGVEIYEYQRGFVHAKTMVVDNTVSIVGTANMDIRSFDLNFEVNAIVYDDEIAEKLTDAFNDDLKDSVRITKEEWEKRSKFKQFLHNLARLLSPVL